MIVEPNCSKRNCIHFQGVKGDSETEQFVYCKAFPNGIPFDIAYGNDKHLKPTKDQKNKIVFREK